MLKNRLNVKEVITEGPRMFLKNIFMVLFFFRFLSKFPHSLTNFSLIKTCQIEAKPMRFSYSRLNSLLRTLEVRICK